MRIQLDKWRCRIDAVGLKEVMVAVGFDWEQSSMLIRHRKSHIRYVMAGWDDKRGKVLLLQDSGKLGGAGTKWSSPKSIITNYEPR